VSFEHVISSLFEVLELCFSAKEPKEEILTDLAYDDHKVLGREQERCDENSSSCGLTFQDMIFQRWVENC